MYQVYRRAWNGEVWTNITSYCNLTTLNVNNALKDQIVFSFELWDRLKNSDTRITLDDGDLIAITEDDNRQRIVFDRLVGKASLKRPIIGADYGNASTKPFREKFIVTCSEIDFSKKTLSSGSYSDTALTTILNVLTFETKELLGGYKGGTYFPKYSLKFTDYNINAFDYENDVFRNAYKDLLSDNGLFSWVKWVCEPDGTNLLNVVGQLQIFNKQGLTPQHPSWSGSGVTDEVIRRGGVTNLANPDQNINELRFYPCCKDVNKDIDRDAIRNIIKLEASTVFNADALNNSDSALTREILISDGGFNYSLGYPAYDVKYVGFLIKSFVTSEGAATTTSFYVPQWDAESMTAGDIIRVVDSNTGNEYFRTIDSISGNQITITVALPFTPATNDRVEVVNQADITIYEDNQENYESLGVVKDLSETREGKIKFLDLSEPPPGIEIVVYYFKIQEYKDTPVNAASVEQYGPRLFEERLKGVYTRDQLRLIAEDLMVLEPIPAIQFTTNRPLFEGESVTVDITDFYNGNLINQSYSAQYLGFKTGFHYWDFDVNLSLNRDELVDILRRFNANNKLTKVSGPNNNRTIQPVNVSTSILFNYVKAAINFLDFDTSVFSYSQYYNFSDGSGTVLTDQEGNQNGTVGNAAKWGAGIGGYSSYTVDVASDVIVIPHNATFFSGGSNTGTAFLFETGSDVSGNRYFYVKDGGSSTTQRQFQWGFIGNQLWIVYYLPANNFFLWKSTSTAILTTNTEYLLTITSDLANDIFLVDLNGSTIAGSVTSGTSITAATSVRFGAFDSGIGAFYQNNGATTGSPSGFKFNRVLLTNEVISQTWIDNEVSRFGL